MSDDLIGGKYQLIQKIGEGGMGAVYQGIDKKLNRPVAIKVLFKQYCDKPESAERFVREAKLAATLSSENDHICEVTDYGNDEKKGLFLVMPILKGRPLNQILTSSPMLDYLRLSDVILQVLDALSYAHREGVIHRDIKPENLFITRIGDREDFVKVLDFGIARIVGDDSAEDLTRTGMLMGTPEYMSPEQCTGAKNVDKRSDLYSVGIVLYRALTGRVPFEGDNFLSIIHKIQNDPIPTPRDFNATIPESLERIVSKAVTRFPADRYQTAEDMALDLRRFQAVLKKESGQQDLLAGAATTVAVDLNFKKAGTTEVMPSRNQPRPNRNKRRVWTLGGAGLLLLLLGSAAFAMIVKFQADEERKPEIPASSGKKTVPPVEDEMPAKKVGEEKIEETEPLEKALPIEWIKSEPAGVAFTKTEITLGQFKQCVSAGGCKEENRKTKSDNKDCNWGWTDRDNHPMNCVNWHGADQFCRWLGGGARLPTEDEWYAEASNGSEKWTWPWGKGPDVSCDYAIWGDGDNTDGCGKDRTWPVCSKPRGNSVSGLCDMSGNVWEWTSSDYDSGAKVLRGGSWDYDYEGALRASYRGRLDPANRYNNIGFRCVRSSH